MMDSLRGLLPSQRVGPPNLAQRQKIAQDTIARSESITEHTDSGASLDSTFIQNQLPPLERSSCPDFPASTVSVFNADSFTVAREIIEESEKQDPNRKAKVAVLNLASDQFRAGGWEKTLSKTQEEALCYSSTLYATLKAEYYPWPNLGPGSTSGVFSPGVVIFRHDLDHGCVDLAPKDRRIVSVITVAAPRGPPLTKDRTEFKNPQHLEDLRGKIRLVYRMAAHNGQEYLVLGAMGCGAYRCPPQLVSKEMKAILTEPEFKGWFRRVVFAVYSKDDFEESNFEIFSKTFRDVLV